MKVERLLDTSKVHHVAILGGGMGGLAAAWRIVSKGANQFRVTVYQRDGLLGGKGGSTRNGSEGYGDRIEEHGIHILMGWYDQMLGLLREVYDYVGQLNDPNLGELLAWDKVLLPEDSAVMGEWPEMNDGDWGFWTVNFPRREGTPGVDKGLPGGVPSAIAKGVDWLAAFHQRARELVGVPNTKPLGLFVAFGSRPEPGVLPKNPEVERNESEAEGILNDLEAIPGGVAKLLAELDTDCQALALKFNHEAKALQTAESKAWLRDARRIFTALWFAKAMVTGLIAEKVRRREDFDRFDDQEFRAWLDRHGGLPFLPLWMRSDSPIVRILYDLAFGHGLDFAAGVWAYAVLLFAFAYKGSYVYKMNGGMGDVVFAPLYLALKKTGRVEFRFHHEVVDLELTGDQVTGIRIKKSSVEDSERGPIGVGTSKNGKVPCWPAESAPVFTGQEETITDFDSVVLAISVGGLEPITRSLQVASPRFKAMLDGSSTTGTMAAQFWLKSGAGWDQKALVAGFARPFNSCVEMSHVLDSETWEAQGGPRPANCVYLCEQAPTATTKVDVRGWLTTFLQKDAKMLMPQFDFEKLVDPQERVGEERVDAQYFRSNVLGSDRYVITPPGSTRFRLNAGASGFSNLALAGDWVTTEVNAGCMEAAASAGLQAGSAVLNWGRPNRYVDSTVDWVRPQPLSFRGASLYILPVKADLQSLSSLCRQLVIEPTEARVQLTPLLSGLLMTFAKIPDGRPTPEPGTGFLRQNECAFFLPVRVQRGANFSYGALVPLAYIDHPVAAIAGREIYGFPKFPAELVAIGEEGFTVRAAALDVFADSSEVTARTILEVKRQSAGVKVLESEFDAATTGILEEVVAEIGIAGTALDSSTLRRMNVLFLKQFRDAVDPYAAALKQVVHAPVVVDGFRSAKVLEGPFLVEIPKLARPALASFLGLASSLQVSKAYELEIDFTFQSGTAL